MKKRIRDRTDGRARFGRPATPIRTASYTLREILETVEDREIIQSSIAEAMGRTNAAFTHWRAGRAIPDILTVEAMAQVLGYRLVLVPERHVSFVSCLIDRGDGAGL